MSVLGRCFVFILFYGVLSLLHAKPVELELWHSMAGSLGEEVNALTQQFNQSQEKYFIKAVYKGNYIETFTSFVAAFRAHKPPAMVQVFEVGTAIMSFSNQVVKPVETLMQEQGFHLPKEDFFPSVRAFYSKKDTLMALPFNLSIPLMYYDADALAKIGYTSRNFPKTWDEFENLAQHLKKAGFQCAYTSAYPGWILWESFLALHGLTMPLHVADEKLFLSHLARLDLWKNKQYFRYAGRDDDATVLFSSGVCPLFSQSLGSYKSLAEHVSFQLGVALMPFDANLGVTRKANVTGGAALWTIAGLSSHQYQGVAQFFSFLLSPKIQKKWHEQTGYLPLGLQGGYAFLLQGQHPNLLLAQTDLKANEKKPYVYQGPANQVRHLNEEILEMLFTGVLSPEKALQSAQLRERQVRMRFLKQYSLSSA